MIHPTAIVNPKAKLGNDVIIGPYAIIEEEVEIGDRVQIAPHVHVRAWTTIGEDCRIHTGAVLGDIPQDLAFPDCRSYLRIGNENVIREYVTIHRGTAPESETVVGDRNYLMGFSHVAHNCQIGNEVVLANAVMLAGYVQVGDRAFLSGHVVVHQFVRIGRLTMISASARIGKDLPPFLIARGTSEVWGVNIVGLRRANFPIEIRSRLRQAYRILYHSGLNTTQALQHLRQNPPIPEIQELIQFIESAKRGTCDGRNLCNKSELRDIATLDDS